MYRFQGPEQVRKSLRPRWYTLLGVIVLASLAMMLLLRTEERLDLWFWIGLSVMDLNGGQGARGYGERLGYSQAARALRQALALGLDSAVRQDPHYVSSPPAKWQRRLGFALKQTVLSRGEQLTWQPAWWRWGSAFGSEAVSDAWRPAGAGLGSRNSWSWAARGAFVLSGDTASNIMREFLPRRRIWGTFFRPFL